MIGPPIKKMSWKLFVFVGRRLSETLGWHFLILRHIQKVPFQGLVEVPYSFKGSRGGSHPIGVVLPNGRCQQWHPWCSAKDVFSVFCLDNPAPCSSGWWRGCMFWAPNFETQPYPSLNYITTCPWKGWCDRLFVLIFGGCYQELLVFPVGMSVIHGTPKNSSNLNSWDQDQTKVPYIDVGVCSKSLWTGVVLG